MIFTETRLKGAYIVELEPIWDERGFFARSFCREEFERHGLNPKLIGCTAGAVYDVIIDLRRESPTYRQWTSVELKAGANAAPKNPKLLYVPEGFAHGYQTLEVDTYLFYQMSEFYHPESSRGVRWNDPVFGVEWPDIVPIISEKDRNLPDFVP
jgi:dTDP-4-dehydrorhamnose 3,5-epimerase